MKSFRQYLKDKFGDGTAKGFKKYKRDFMQEPGHFKHDWIKFINTQKKDYKVLKKFFNGFTEIESLLKNLKSDPNYLCIKDYYKDLEYKQEMLWEIDEFLYPKDYDMWLKKRLLLDLFIYAGGRIEDIKKENERLISESIECLKRNTEHDTNVVGNYTYFIKMTQILLDYNNFLEEEI